MFKAQSVLIIDASRKSKKKLDFNSVGNLDQPEMYVRLWLGPAQTSLYAEKVVNLPQRDRVNKKS
jgi:hypothetical protein